VGGNAQIKAMKKVAGSLRLDLAQYRELEAFAKFGSDLDPTTQRQLNRGARLVEILKQPQYQPLPVEEQVAIISAATAGHLDTVPVERVREFEREFLDALRLRHADALRAVATTGQVSDETAALFAREAQDLAASYAQPVAA